MNMSKRIKTFKYLNDIKTVKELRTEVPIDFKLAFLQYELDGILKNEDIELSEGSIYDLKTLAINIIGRISKVEEKNVSEYLEILQNSRSENKE